MMSTHAPSSPATANFKIHLTPRPPGLTTGAKISGTHWHPQFWHQSQDWTTKRMKALRFRLIGLPGRVVRHARKLIIRLGAGPEALETIVNARAAIRALACGPAG